MPGDEDAGERPAPPDLEQLERSIHASYLSRWIRHLEAAARDAGRPDPAASPPRRREPGSAA